MGMKASLKRSVKQAVEHHPQRFSSAAIHAALRLKWELSGRNESNMWDVNDQLLHCQGISVICYLPDWQPILLTFIWIFEL